MADLVTPPWGYFAPGSSLFSNPQGSAPLIGPRIALGAPATTGAAIPPGGILFVPSTVTVDTSFPHSGRCYYFEWGAALYAQASGDPGALQIFSTRLTLQFAGGTYAFPLGTPNLTTLTQFDSSLSSVISIQPELLIRTQDLIDLARVTGTTTTATLQISSVIAAKNNATTDPASFSVQTQALVRFIDGMYG